MKRLSKHLTYANVMATIAVFFSLAGGAYAVSVPRNSVGTTQLKKKAVTEAKIRPGTITSRSIKSFSLNQFSFQSGVLPKRGEVTSPAGTYKIVATDSGITLSGPGQTLTLTATGVDVSAPTIRLGGNGCNSTAAIWGLSTTYPSTKVKLC